MDWDDYEVYDPGVYGPLQGLPRREARQAYNKLMSEKEQRKEILKRLLKANGVDLTERDESVQDLNDWFRANVTADPTNPERLLPEWYSVVNDVALFLGDVIIERYPTLYWEFHTWGKTRFSYQRHVIMGFEPEAAHICLDIDRAVEVYANLVVDGETVDEEAFWKWIRDTGERPRR